MNKRHISICLVLLLLVSCSVDNDETARPTEIAPTGGITTPKILTYKAPGISFSAFEIDYDPEAWQEQKVEGSTLRYLESVQQPGCIFQDLLGSGNGPYGEEFHFTIDGRKFTYYLNTPDDYPVEKAHQSLLIYYKDPKPDSLESWGFQVFADSRMFDQCFDLVKELLKNLRLD
ncbi:MAG: hypothetical protein WA110_10350 [Anaerolineaceae bacterium]